jgi:hypothetical protein
MTRQDRQTRWVIGGEFELRAEMLRPQTDLAALDILSRGQAGVWTVSGRAALTIILEKLKSRGVRHIHLPAYLCQSLIQPIRTLELAFSFYPVDEQLIAYPDPPSGAAVVLIHYFGWLNPATDWLRARAGRDFYLLEDMTQALLSDWRLPRDTQSILFFSARKFGPVPLGGWCNLETSTQQPPPTNITMLATRSLEARYLRGEYLAHPNDPPDPTVESAYLDAFRAIEAALDAQLGCSALPNCAIETIARQDWKTIASRRRANWQEIDMQITDRARHTTPTLEADTIPLGYVICLINRDQVRARMAQERIFCPVHWPLPPEVDGRRFPIAARLAETCLTLPIDQRYGPEDMRRTVETLKKCLKTPHGNPSSRRVH